MWSVCWVVRCAPSMIILIVLLVRLGTTIIRGLVPCVI